MINIKTVIAIALSALTYSLFGQTAEVNAKLDTTLMMIGDQTAYTITAKVPKNAEVTFPVLTDTLIEKVEILRNLPFDTAISADTKTIIKPYIITCFDSGSYAIKPFPVAIQYNDSSFDTLFTQPAYMAVQTFHIDSTANAIADIKDPIDTPLTFKEFMQEYAIYAGLFILVLALVFTIWWYVIKQQKKQEEQPIKVKPKEPPHVIALRELDELQGRKLWQQDKIKLHYSILSDIVRQYLEYRFDVPAMENTTGFILETIDQRKTLNKENTDKVKEILEVSDLAKFAKYTPLPDDNSRTLDYAYQLVLTTKERVFETEPKEVKKDELE